ncbi:VWA-like domain-containing protein [Marimonas sp. MJW-29]|uniref:VWA-like domain-containing protein n=1 Tax=Sulfitobacter sediminis TaxID=3234186 RepID=A0ABV3RMD9_9RHOB
MTDAAARHSGRAAPALRALAEADPAIAALSLWCRHRDGAETRTDGETISYGADFAALMPHEQMGLAAHHILHVALRHPARLAGLAQRLGKGFDPELYNLAADAVVNEALLQADHALPRPAVRLSELLAQTLGKEVAAQEALAEWDVERLYFALSKAESGEGRAREAASEYAQAQAFESDLDPSPGEADAAGEVEQAARWRQHMARAMDAGRQAGRGIGRIGHRLADVPQPRVPWEVLLRRLLSQAVMQAPQPSPQRPSRRWIAASAEAARRGDRTPGFQPGQRPLTEVPRIVIGLDASSSIDDARLRLFWAEVTGIARRMRAALELLVFDDEVRHRARLDPAQTRFDLPNLPRGGGTAFVPVIAEAVKLGASALVMLTDLEGEAGLPPKGFPVIWVVPEPGALQPPFGRLVDMTA